MKIGVDQNFRKKSKISRKNVFGPIARSRRVRFQNVLTCYQIRRNRIFLEVGDPENPGAKYLTTRQTMDRVIFV